MPNPTIVFGILISTLYGTIYHLLRGGTTRTMLGILMLAWAGFWLGDVLGSLIGWSFFWVGNLNAGMGTISSFVFMLAGDVLMHLRRPSDKG